MSLPNKVRAHCLKCTIEWSWMGDSCYEFIAPRGFVFPNKSRHQGINLDDEGDADRIILSLRLGRRVNPRPCRDIMYSSQLEADLAFGAKFDDKGFPLYD